MKQIILTVKAYIQDNIATDEFEDDLDLFESGLINSLFTIQLMTYLEKTFAIKITMDDLELSNFCSVNAIAIFVQKKLDKIST